MAEDILLSLCACLWLVAGSRSVVLGPVGFALPPLRGSASLAVKNMRLIFLFISIFFSTGILSIGTVLAGIPARLRRNSRQAVAAGSFFSTAVAYIILLELYSSLHVFSTHTFTYCPYSIFGALSLALPNTVLQFNSVKWFFFSDFSYQ